MMDQDAMESSEEDCTSWAPVRLGFEGLVGPAWWWGWGERRASRQRIRLRGGGGAGTCNGWGFKL